MRVRLIALLAALALVVSVIVGVGPDQTGEIFGKVTDESGAVLPGVTVTITSPVAAAAAVGHHAARPAPSSSRGSTSAPTP